ncbi:hypothetical protein SAY86_004680 [Trapa natans]|uniref:Uncharacterized protein n=1 Tax=Trapa natans TaxID=22666 RepID=A0AAN7N718_TRANT|nr:hypothetical protein SAY86_004680 [Trapa natans]
MNNSIFTGQSRALSSYFLLRSSPIGFSSASFIFPQPIPLVPVLCNCSALSTSLVAAIVAQYGGYPWVNCELSRFVLIFSSLLATILIARQTSMLAIAGKASFIGPRLLLGSQTSRLMRREMEPVLFSSFQCSRRKLWCLSSIYLRGRHAVLAAGSSSYGSSSESDLSPEEPFWLALVKELIWSLKSLLSFLREQPNQLKYIEWPGFQSTLKTAILTLILVALLMVIPLWKHQQLGGCVKHVGLLLMVVYSNDLLQVAVTEKARGRLKAQADHLHRPTELASAWIS